MKELTQRTIKINTFMVVLFNLWVFHGSKEKGLFNQECNLLFRDSEPTDD
jgi:hypothetical protein